LNPDGIAAPASPAAPSAVSGPIASPDPDSIVAAHQSIPDLSVGLAPSEVVACLERKSQQGKLPGFRRDPDSSTTFRLALYGAPYDRDLIVSASPVSTGSTLRFRSHLRRTLPWIVIFTTIITFWPGVLLTDSLMATWFPSWYPKQLWVTCAWYLPLCVLMIPALWKQYRVSERASEEHLRETLAKLAAWLAKPR
jgi:hypothetical protein